MTDATQHGDGSSKSHGGWPLIVSILLAGLLAIGVWSAAAPNGRRSTLALDTGTTLPLDGGNPPASTTSTNVPATSAAVASTSDPVTAPLTVSAASGSLSVKVTISAGTTPTATLVHFTTEITDTAGGILATGGTYGDTKYSEPLGQPDCGGGPPSGPPPSPTAAHKIYDDDHAYRFAKTYRFSIVAISVACGRPERRVEVPGDIVVTPGADVSNGPAPVNLVTRATPQANGVVQLAADARDRDGYITVVTVSWGDGSPDDTTTYPLSDCVEKGLGWPSSHQFATFTHTYPTPGAHNVTVVATSTGCGGTDAQTARNTSSTST